MGQVVPRCVDSPP